jgi:phage shock protein PspC (stress-responsive transcriptional regulator)/heme/copper-type cytochrome/quinol oxidase subunit 2
MVLSQYKILHMKKIININFSGSAIAIDELAYEKLQAYIESLRKYFANEESKEEIISDIENRIGELCANKLKSGSDCIVVEDIEEIKQLMGTPDDLRAEEERIENLNDTTSGNQQQNQYSQYTTRGKFLRNTSDKLVSGVCSGLANYLNIDPAVIRILFIVFAINGIGLLIYILLWVIVPASDNLPTSIYRRLYRNPDSKMMGGVSSGIASYFKIDVWIPRVIFLSPVILNSFYNVLNNGQYLNPFRFNFFNGSFGGMFFLTYIILWIVLPEANSDVEKQAMRGEKMDINTIKENIKNETRQFGEKIEQLGNEMGNNMKTFSASNTSVAQKKSYAGFGSILALIIKAFALFMVGIMVFSLLMLLLSGSIAGVTVLPLKNFILDGGIDYLLFYATLIGVIFIPLAAILFWVIRIFIKNKRNYPVVGWVTGIGVTAGIIAAIFLGARITKNYRVESDLSETTINIANNTTDTLHFNANVFNYMYRDIWMSTGGGFEVINGDSILVRDVNLYFRQSKDTSTYMEIFKESQGANETIADNNAKQIAFNTSVSGNNINIDEGFVVSSNQKYRGQEIKIIIYVPKGRKLTLNDKLIKYCRINGNRSGFNKRRSNKKWRNRDYESHWSMYNSDDTYIVTANNELKSVKDNNRAQDNDNNQEQQSKNRRKSDSIEAEKRKIELEKEDLERKNELKREELDRKKEKLERLKNDVDDGALILPSKPIVPMALVLVNM